MAQLFANNAASTLNGAIGTGTMSIALQTGDGAKFPSPSGGDFFEVTLFQKSGLTELNYEVVTVTGRTGDTLTIGARGQENTTPFAFNNGDSIELRFTAGAAGSLAPKFNAILTTPTLATAPAQSDSSVAVACTSFVQAAVNGAQSVPVGGGVAVTLTAAQAAAQTLTFTGVLTANITVAVPAAPKTFTAFNKTTGAFTLTVIATGGTGIAVTQGKSQELICDGTNVVLASSDVVGAGASPTAGSTSVTTLGTITTGTWQGTLHNSTYGGTGINNGGRTIAYAGNVAFTGAFTCTFNLSAATSVTLPAGGTLLSTTAAALGNNNVSGVKNLMLNGDYATTWASNATSVNWSNGQCQTVTLTSSGTITIGVPPGVGHYQLTVIQNATGGFAATWAGVAATNWIGLGSAPALNTVANGRSIVNFYYDGTTLTQAMSRVGVP